MLHFQQNKGKPYHLQVAMFRGIRHPDPCLSRRQCRSSSGFRQVLRKGKPRLGETGLEVSIYKSQRRFISSTARLGRLYMRVSRNWGPIFG